MVGQAVPAPDSPFGIPLAIAGVVLAVTAAVITNVVLYRRGRRATDLDRSLAEHDASVAEAMSALTRSLTESGFARTYMGFVETQPFTPPAAYDSYFRSSIRRRLQAGFWLTSGLPPEDRDALNAQLSEAHRTASEAGRGEAMAQLVDLNDELGAKVAERYNQLVHSAMALREERAALERGSDTVWHIGTTVQILSLVAVAAGNLAGA